MELAHTFWLSVPVAEAWPLLVDLERIAPCLPGAQLLRVEGDRYSGLMAVQAGPVTVRFRGHVTVAERDNDTRRLVVEARGRHTGGRGGAEATVAAHLHPAGERTRVDVRITLTFAGAVGRLDWETHARIAGGLVERFAACVDQMALHHGPASSPPTLELTIVAAPVLRRVGAVLLASLIGLVLCRAGLTRRRRGR